MNSTREEASLLSGSKKSHVKASRLYQSKVFSIAPSTVGGSSWALYPSGILGLDNHEFELCNACLHLLQNAVSQKLYSSESSMLVWGTALGFSMSVPLSLNRIAVWQTCTTLPHRKGNLYRVDKGGSPLIQTSDSWNWFKYLGISTLLQKDSSTTTGHIKTGFWFHRVLWNFSVSSKVCLVETCILSQSHHLISL